MPLRPRQQQQDILGKTKISGIWRNSQHTHKKRGILFLCRRVEKEYLGLSTPRHASALFLFCCCCSSFREDPLTSCVVPVHSSRSFFLHACAFSRQVSSFFSGCWRLLLLFFRFILPLSPWLLFVVSFFSDRMARAAKRTNDVDWFTDRASLPKNIARKNKEPLFLSFFLSLFFIIIPLFERGMCLLTNVCLGRRWLPPAHVPVACACSDCTHTHTLNHRKIAGYHGTSMYLPVYTINPHSKTMKKMPNCSYAPPPHPTYSAKTTAPYGPSWSTPVCSPSVVAIQEEEEQVLRNTWNYFAKKKKEKLFPLCSPH